MNCSKRRSFINWRNPHIVHSIYISFFLAKGQSFLEFSKTDVFENFLKLMSAAICWNKKILILFGKGHFNWRILARVISIDVIFFFKKCLLSAKKTQELSYLKKAFKWIFNFNRNELCPWHNVNKDVVCNKSLACQWARNWWCLDYSS